jgi:hypothetical protein
MLSPSMLFRHAQLYEVTIRYVSTHKVSSQIVAIHIQPIVDNSYRHPLPCNPLPPSPGNVQFDFGQLGVHQVPLRRKERVGEPKLRLDVIEFSEVLRRVWGHWRWGMLSFNTLTNGEVGDVLDPGGTGNIMTRP